MCSGRSGSVGVLIGLVENAFDTESQPTICNFPEVGWLKKNMYTVSTTQDSEPQLKLLYLPDIPVAYLSRD